MRDEIKLYPLKELYIKKCREYFTNTQRLAFKDTLRIKYHLDLMTNTNEVESNVIR